MAEQGRRASVCDPFEAWFDALWERHLGGRTFGEVRRGLEALSAIYVERRDRISAGDALRGWGKRAAFAVFYGPLHFLLAREIVRGLGAASPPPRRILDLGCGIGASSAAWALEAGAAAVSILGIDRNLWAVEEAEWTYRILNLRGRGRRADLNRAPLPGRGGVVLFAFTVNELRDLERERLEKRLLAVSRRGVGCLVIEPIARAPVPWWDAWASSFENAGGRADTWRIPIRLPHRLAQLDHAAGLDHGDISGRSLWLAPS